MGSGLTPSTRSCASWRSCMRSIRGSTARQRLMCTGTLAEGLRQLTNQLIWETSLQQVWVIIGAHLCQQRMGIQTGSWIVGRQLEMEVRPQNGDSRLENGQVLHGRQTQQN